jgi:ABC-2 type transport system ATP-binding protein
MTNPIHTENLSKKFHRLDALNGLNLDVPVGAIYALVGPNGAGKTTAVKILMNMLRPTHGLATVMGMDSSRLRGGAFTAIGYVSENQEQPEWMRVNEFLDYLRPFYPSWDRNLEKQLVTQFDLPPDRKLKHLSRGMRMKVALASSLAYHPELIILDEPFSGLDPLVRDQLIEGLLERAPESTILISSHDLAEVETFASHVGYLDQGTLRFSEEMTTLSDRFREVELTFDTPPALPEPWPPAWLHPASTSSVVRFIDSRFEAERTATDIRRMFGSARDITFTPMSLRSIFLAMARPSREQHEGRGTT